MPFCPKCGHEFMMEEEPKEEAAPVIVDYSEEAKLREEGETERALIAADKEIAIAEINAEAAKEVAEAIAEAEVTEEPKEEPKEEKKDDDEVEEVVVDEIPANDENEERDSPPQTKEQEQAQEREDVRPRSMHRWWRRG